MCHRLVSASDDTNRSDVDGRGDDVDGDRRSSKAVNWLGTLVSWTDDVAAPMRMVSYRWSSRVDDDDDVCLGLSVGDAMQMWAVVVDPNTIETMVLWCPLDY